MKLKTLPSCRYKTLPFPDALKFSKEMTDIIDSSPSSENAIEHPMNRLLESVIPRTYAWRPGVKHLSSLGTIWYESSYSGSLLLNWSFSVTGALERIEQAVEKFRKNKISPIDGVNILIEMRFFINHNLLFIKICTSELNVSRYLSHISQIIREGLIKASRTILRNAKNARDL